MEERSRGSTFLGSLLGMFEKERADVGVLQVLHVCTIPEEDTKYKSSYRVGGKKITRELML